MKVYLVQHGDSVEADVDPDRPLSKKGREDIEKLGKFLAKSNLTLYHIIHSGKLRAEQTAEILAKALKFENGIESRLGLGPLDNVREIMEELNYYSNDILIAGHLPFMSKLVSMLVVGDENKLVVSFEPGTLVCLENIADERWVIHFMLRPSIFQSS